MKNDLEKTKKFCIDNEREILTMVINIEQM
ncbi:hypothetical protein J2S01_000219 [Pectinatus haikarae]|uniref:MarR family transcriptional regulator n=1 Tax=Pectinatus haikarae TaxID=349096 RepID=A0ABT9Y3X9_9FIRM|nr:hypothetical protein [Pectinatus haikarae]